MKYLLAVSAILFGVISLLVFSGYLQMCLGLIEPMAIPIVLEGTAEYEEIEAQLVGQNVLVPLIGVLCMVFSIVMFSAYHRLNKRKKGIYNYQDISNPFVLYLRSFSDDCLTKKRISLVSDIRSEEEILVDVLSDIAPVYAIGDPKDKKMPNGASRIYVDDEHWKSIVEDLAKRADVVALRLGKTDSFWWEVDMVVKNLPLEKVLFVVPQSKTFSNVANLYKILLDNNIDIRTLDINVDRKLSGSISSFFFFNSNGEPVVRDVKMVRFARLFLSYENILRNALSLFREKYGLAVGKRLSFRLMRFLQVSFILGLLFIAGSKAFSDNVDLKYQMPYELAIESVKNPQFVAKYSSEINGTNLVWSLVESRKGMVALDDDDCRFLFAVETSVVMSMSEDELARIDEAPENMLLMVKKHEPEQYANYVLVLYKAVEHSLKDPKGIMQQIEDYKSSSYYVPQWFGELEYDSVEIGQNDYLRAVYSVMFEHIDDDGFSDLLKFIWCSGMR